MEESANQESNTGAQQENVQSETNNQNSYNPAKLVMMNTNRFEDYLVQALNESLMKKSK